MEATKRYIIQQIIISLGVLSLLFISCAEPENKDVWGSNKEMIMLDYLETRADLSITVEALKKTYVYGTLSTYGPYTFLCPNNDAWTAFFTKYNYAGIEAVETSFLESLFEYHILPFEKKLENLENGPMGKADTTINGHRLLIDISGGLDSVVINNQSVISDGNIETWNGVVHAISQVLDPPVLLAGDYLKSKPEYSKFVSFLQSQHVLDTLSLRYSTIYPNPSNEFTVFALTNEAMDKLQITIDSLEKVDSRYHSEVARDPDYALRVTPNQVTQLARSFILSGVEYISTMYSGFKPTLGEIPYGDGFIRMKVVANDGYVFINDAVKVYAESSDVIVENGLIHKCTEGFVFLPESPRDFVYSASPIERWNTNLGAIVTKNSSDGYIGDIENVYGISNLDPERVGAEFWIEIPDVPSGRYMLTLIAKKQGSKMKIIVGDKLLSFEGIEDDGSYDFAYLLGNKGRVDNLTPNPCSKGGLYLMEIPTGVVEVGQDQKKVIVKFHTTYINPAGAKIALSAILFEPLAE